MVTTEVTQSVPHVVSSNSVVLSESSGTQQESPRHKGSRTNGSARRRKKQKEKINRWTNQGLALGSINIAGMSLFKLFLLLEEHQLDILCIQETWLPPSTCLPTIPGYVLYEQRRVNGTRGGIAMLVRKGIKVIQVTGNEYAQGVCLQLVGGEIAWVCNVYLPPVQNLRRRGVDECVACSYVEDILSAVPSSARAFICGDFNARVGTCSPCVGNVALPR